jgi:Protein of unknown function (DUF3467)
MSSDRQNPSTSVTQSRAVRSQFYRESYANAFRFKLSPLDLTIVFSTPTEMPGVFQDEAAVSMGFAALKILTTHLNETLGAIETELGAIRVPKGSLPTKEQTAQLIRSLREADFVEAD